MEFVELYERAVFRYVRSKGLQNADAIEVVQEVLIAVHRSVDEWNPNGAGSFRAWLLRVSSNLATSLVRQKHRERMLTGGTHVCNALNAASSAADQDTANEEDLEWRQWAFCWASSKAQREVSDVTWRAFWLTAVETRPPADVAKQLELSVGAVYAAKCRVLQRLRVSVGEIEEDHTIPQDTNSNESHNEKL
ncbi:MAG: sigma-70 family RNA polymerase sigma factor [Planctomycetota bacterium]|jgi:RNA polymerase sigma-70 factor (ECF subfamily)